MVRLLVSLLVSASASVAALAGGPDGRGRAHLTDEKCTDADVRALADASPRVRHLSIGWPGMTDSALKEVGKLKTVVSICIGNPSIYYGGGEVKQVVISAAGWKALRDLPDLRELSVNDVKIDAAAMAEIGQLRQLTTLYLAHNGITDAGVRHLAGMTQVTKLGLLQRDVTDESVPVLMKLQAVETLLVDQTELTDAAAKQFATLPRLVEIDVRHGKVTSAGVQALGACKTLRRLSVLQRQVPPDVLDALREGNRDLSVGITDVGKYLEPVGKR